MIRLNSVPSDHKYFVVTHYDTTLTEYRKDWALYSVSVNSKRIPIAHGSFNSIVALEESLSSGEGA